MSDLIEHAKGELEIIENNCKDKDGLEMQKLMDKQVLEVLEVLCNQGHSGFSAHYIINIIKKLWMCKPISDLTGEDGEWIDVSHDSYQNKRCPAIFKNKETGRAYWLDGYVYCEPFSNAWFSCSEVSRKYITFPCSPSSLKTEYRKLLFPDKYVPIKWAVRLHLYRVVR